ncbi:hypothetical protein DPMN_118373 [Dreissena polymorpha]|uniref:Ricin B lectin domain-containing protein n=1 Tax=Dreissena polymorpha TaxID=45954 RepID=A0A9D4GGT5_DREPO|nr:hypothetical protein DPMN_118373 [Dreissena polymorpha]
MWSVGKVGMVNLFRVAYTWLDQPYRQVVIDYSGEKPSEVDVGDVSERRALREANACHSFQYFVDKVKSFASIHDPAQSRWIGSLKNNGNSMCLEASYPLEEKVGHSNCHGRGYNQLFEWTGKSELRHLGHCLYVLPGGRVIMKHCDHFEDPSHKTWVFDEAPGSVLHVQSNTCLTMDKKSVVATKCNQTPEQRWRVVPVSVTS